MTLNTDPFPIINHSDTIKKTSSLDSIGRYLQYFFLLLVLFTIGFHTRSESFTTFSIIFSAIVLEALPFMLLGTLIGGFVEVFLSQKQLIRFLPKNKRLSIVAAAFMGIFFPVCECAIVPVVRKFIQKGMPLGAAVSFLLGGPIVNPLVFSSTLVAYSFSVEIAFLRVGLGVCIAITVGMLIHSLIKEDQALLLSSARSGFDCHNNGCNHNHMLFENLSLVKKIRAALYHGAVDFYDIGRFLIIGAFIAAALQTLVARQTFLSMTSGPILAIVAMMALAVILNLCSEADAFIAVSFKPLGLPLSAQMAFMVLGPMLDIKLILMYMSVFTRKMILILIFNICQVVFLVMVAMEVSQWFAS